MVALSEDQQDEYEDLFPVNALAWIFIPGVETGQNILHTQLKELIERHRSEFGDQLQDAIRPFYHAVKYAPLAMRRYRGRPLEAYPQDERRDGHQRLREKGYESYRHVMAKFDLARFESAKAHAFSSRSGQAYVAWTDLDRLLKCVVAHMAICAPRKQRVTEGDLEGDWRDREDDEGVITLSDVLPRRDELSGRERLRNATPPSQPRLKLVRPRPPFIMGVFNGGGGKGD